MKRMKVRLIALNLTIILLIILPFIFLSSTQTEETQKVDSSDDCDSSYIDFCIESYPLD